MDTWTRQMGFPLITVIRKGDTIIATQKRFLLTASLDNETKLQSEEPMSAFGYKWYVPLSFYTDVQPNDIQHVWMNLTDGNF